MTERTGTSVRKNRNQCQKEQVPVSERTGTSVRKNRYQCQKEQVPEHPVLCQKEQDQLY
ncbi:hypothetical protein DPMN_077497 [Dreissena polymorpha]|uniref:Uncharacterized protein n=1 Tax=Dreissena polymorpha TaxID=45954 RepID=A0A9D3YPF2_DREPO|nr:hypothetical protein DPMN_077497 [Dreissena polymorpha]